LFVKLTVSLEAPVLRTKEKMHRFAEQVYTVET